MTYEVSAAAKPPQTAPFYLGIGVNTREGNGEHRRCRAVAASLFLESFVPF
jgi:hypothetical protein